MTLLYFCAAGFEPSAQKTKKYVQKVRGIKEKGMYQAVLCSISHMLVNWLGCNQQHTLSKPWKTNKGGLCNLFSCCRNTGFTFKA